MELMNTFDAKPAFILGAGYRPSRGPLTYRNPDEFIHDRPGSF